MGLPLRALVLAGLTAAVAIVLVALSLVTALALEQPAPIRQPVNAAITPSGICHLSIRSSAP